MKIDFISTDCIHNVRHELGHQTSDYEHFNEDAVVEMMERCDEYQKLEVDVHVVYSNVLVLS